jgi:hypothetical protein
MKIYLSIFENVLQLSFGNLQHPTTLFLLCHGKMKNQVQHNLKHTYTSNKNRPMTVAEEIHCKNH